MRPALLTTALALALALAGSARGVIIDSGDGTGNTTAPAAEDCVQIACSDPGWRNVGVRTNGLTGVYLGGRFVLTANHVGPGDIVLDGATYAYVPGTAVQLDNGDGTTADLLMFEIYPEPPLTALAIASLPPLASTPVIMIGNGRNRGPATTWNLIGGYDWGGGQTMRWGTNAVTGGSVIEIAPNKTMAIETSFDQDGSDHEAQGAVGDSGGATFALNGSQWELAGILFAILGYPEQPVDESLYGNQTASADLSFYRSQILDVMAMPEPRGGLWPGAAAVAVLACRRRAGFVQRFAFASTRS